MKRKVLIFTNPGEIDDENYCKGVYKDVDNYNEYFYSPSGGYWSESEVEHLDKPTSSLVKRKLEELTTTGVELSIIIFCGHGWFSSKSNSSIICLRRGQELDSLELRKNAKKRIIILDSCRKVHDEYINERELIKARMFSESIKAMRLNGDTCRRLYNQEAEKCDNQIIVIHAAGISETAGDSESVGGYYSSSLLSTCRELVDQRIKNIDLSTQYVCLRIPSIHSSAIPKVLALSGGLQNPQIEKPRLETAYLPFGIVA